MQFVLIDGAAVRDGNVTSVQLLQVACGKALMAVLGLSADGSIPSVGVVWSGGRLSYQTGAVAVVAVASVGGESLDGRPSATNVLASLGIRVDRPQRVTQPQPEGIGVEGSLGSGAGARRRA